MIDENGPVLSTESSSLKKGWSELTVKQDQYTSSFFIFPAPTKWAITKITSLAGSDPNIRLLTATEAVLTAKGHQRPIYHSDHSSLLDVSDREKAVGFPDHDIISPETATVCGTTYRTGH